MSQAYEDEKLGGAAREARERLDERLRTQRKSLETKRQLSGGKESLRCVDGRSGGELHTEVFGSSKSCCSSRSGSKRFNWAKLSWKASEQEECAICLERFKTGETLVHLPCAHRFHGRCLVPWLEANAHCPCCRMEMLPPPLPSPN
ncbi:hypothetical protein Pint_14708 [Pistacia integerrima]|uniref:Uncharacterized protein n=1 Tax=Pistacia integerrima TaxID=434235 RepID=A0ACC0Y7Z6_9ROSI|nr:hypothetical protein Pint_14708 [Pistacia integerrima]